MERLPELAVPGPWENVLTGPSRQALEDSVLPRFLLAQRWFGAKARGLQAVRVADWAVLSPALLTLLELRFADGPADLYFVPLGVSADPPPSARAHALARLAGPHG